MADKLRRLFPLRPEARPAERRWQANRNFHGSSGRSACSEVAACSTVVGPSNSNRLYLGTDLYQVVIK